MSRRTNKTARVLSLITGGKDAEIVNEEEQVEDILKKNAATSLNDPKKNNEPPSIERSASETTPIPAENHSDRERLLPMEALDIPKDPDERASEKEEEDPFLKAKTPKDYSTDEISESPEALSQDRSTGNSSTDASVEDKIEDVPMGQFKKFMSERMANSNQKKILHRSSKFYSMTMIRYRI